MHAFPPSADGVACAVQIQYFSRAFQPMEGSFIETLRAVILSVRWFLVLLVLTLWGFAGKPTALSQVQRCKHSTQVLLDDVRLPSGVVAGSLHLCFATLQTLYKTRSGGEPMHIQYLAHAASVPCMQRHQTATSYVCCDAGLTGPAWLP